MPKEHGTKVHVELTPAELAAASRVVFAVMSCVDQAEANAAERALKKFREAAAAKDPIPRKLAQ